MALGQLFRIESGKLVAVLTRLLGRSRWEVAEEIVQETLIKALQVWSMHGTPDRPAAWLMTVAKNKAVDWLRKEARNDRVLASLKHESAFVGQDIDTEPSTEDDQLRMLLACCDLRLSLPDRVALTLKAVGGLSHGEIAAALLLPEDTVRKRLYRAKELLKAQGDFPAVSAADLPLRFESVLEVLYLMFNEGYKSTSHAVLIRFELCEEALRVCWELRRNASAPLPQLHALMALMYFHMARFSSRTAPDGSIQQLQHQDRTLWNREWLCRGFVFFRASAQGRTLSRFHLEAAIASHHCAADRFETTNWPAIVGLYEQLLLIHPSPIVKLNRAIAVGFSEGPAAALGELTSLTLETELQDYPLYHASLGEFLSQAGELFGAKLAYQRARELCSSPQEREFLQKKIWFLETQLHADA